jgi:membrane-bound metal-dependent hydrolase YbcI (DUF457 family)
MPGYRTHLTAAVGAGVAAVAITHRHEPLSTLFSLTIASQLIAAFLGGLFPDIDIKSKGQQVLYAIVTPCLCATLLARNIFLSTMLAFLAILPPLIPHRGITHELWFIVLAPLCGPLLVSMYNKAWLAASLDLYLFFVLGAFTHLLLDLGPKELLKRALPFSPKHTRKKR